MDSFAFNVTAQISEVFDKHNVKYKVFRKMNSEAVAAGFRIENGPNLLVYFIVSSERGDVAVRMYNVITGVPENKRVRMLEACNLLNYGNRYLKYCLDNDNAVQAAYDFPAMRQGENIGEAAASLFVAIMRSIDAHYRFLIKALYTEEPLNNQKKQDAAGRKEEEDDTEIPDIHSLN